MPVESTIDIDDPVLEFARQLASTPSVTGSEEAAIRLTIAAMEVAGFDSVTIDEAGNAVGVVGSGPGPRLLLDGHIDSIPLHSIDRWTVDPFGGVIRDGALYGLGICDQKASIAAAVYGVAAAAKAGRLGAPVAVVASVGEEAMEGQALATAVERFRPDIVITTEPNDTRLGIGQRGRAKAYVRVKGRACHAGHAREGINAVSALAALIVEADAIVHPTHPQLGGRDLTCIDIASKPYPSVSTVPHFAEARFDCRFLPGETPESIAALLLDAADRAWAGWTERPEIEVGLEPAQFSTWTGAAFDTPEFCHAWWTDEASSTVKIATEALIDAGLDPTPTHYDFCTNGSLTAGLLHIPTIGFGVGSEPTSHQVDEHVTLESLAKGRRGYESLAAHLTKGTR